MATPRASEDGGGIEVGYGTTLQLTRVAVLNNSAINGTSLSNGGGIDSAATSVVKQSLVAGNHGYNGGAIAASGLIKATDSTFFKNFAGNPTFNGNGGAFDDDVLLIDSTVVGNQCFNGDGCGGAMLLDDDRRGHDLRRQPCLRAERDARGSPGNPGPATTAPARRSTRRATTLTTVTTATSGRVATSSTPRRGLATSPTTVAPTKTLALRASSPAFNGGAGSCTGPTSAASGVRRAAAATSAPSNSSC